MSSIKPRLGGVAPELNDPARQIAPQHILPHGTRIDDRVGYRFAAMLRPGFAAGLPSELLKLLSRSEILVVADGGPGLQAWLDATEADAVPVRPDRYVLGAARSIQEFEALVSAVASAPGASRRYG